MKSAAREGEEVLEGAKQRKNMFNCKAGLALLYSLSYMYMVCM